MRYEMGVRDRLALLSVLPVEGTLTTIRIVRELREALSFGEAEHRDLQMVEEGGQIRWEPQAERKRGIEIGGKGQEIVRAALRKLDEEGKLREEHVALCDLFEVE